MVQKIEKLRPWRLTSLSEVWGQTWAQECIESITTCFLTLNISWEHLVPHLSFWIQDKISAWVKLLPNAQYLLSQNRDPQAGRISADLHNSTHPFPTEVWLGLGDRHLSSHQSNQRPHPPHRTSMSVVSYRGQGILWLRGIIRPEGWVSSGTLSKVLFGKALLEELSPSPGTWSFPHLSWEFCSQLCSALILRGQPVLPPPPHHSLS